MNMEFTQDYSKRSLSDVAVLYIKDKILSGEFKSGDKIIETDISNDLNISRGPIREGLRQLSMQGILNFSPRRGNQILEMTREDIIEMFCIRISLENQILKIIIKNKLLNEENFHHLTNLIDQMIECEKKDLELHKKIYMLNTLDISFHKYLWDISKSNTRSHILEGLFFQLLIAMNKDLTSLGTFKEKAAEHIMILETLKENDVEKALKAFKQHMGEYIIKTLGEDNLPELDYIV